MSEDDKACIKEFSALVLTVTAIKEVFFFMGVKSKELSQKCFITN